MDSNNFTIAEIHGFTNTLRFRHKKPIVNLPKVFKFYGEQIRGAIIPPSEEYLLCGADMTSLEDTTKQHYMYFFDPEYVEQMRVPGFDPHLDIAVLSKMLTEEQAEAHKQKLEDHSQIRGRAKVVNFAGVYGAGPPKIALTSGMTLSEAKKLHTIYWQRNKAVKLVEKSCAVKTIGEQMWLLNPVSGFWYSLRYLKDRFSTLNQGTGVYCFDLWVREVRSRGIKITLQYHDEVVIALLKEQKEEVDKSLRDSIDSVNEKVKLNVPLGVDVQFGINYAKIH
jgi:DNA polymerase I-like protein with 3'-5' exonuclease and polymerase domains